MGFFKEGSTAKNGYKIRTKWGEPSRSPHFFVLCKTTQTPLIRFSYTTKSGIYGSITCQGGEAQLLVDGLKYSDLRDARMREMGHD